MIDGNEGQLLFRAYWHWHACTSFDFFVQYTLARFGFDPPIRYILLLIYGSNHFVALIRSLHNIRHVSSSSDYNFKEFQIPDEASSQSHHSSLFSLVMVTNKKHLLLRKYISHQYFEENSPVGLSPFKILLE